MVTYCVKLNSSGHKHPHTHTHVHSHTATMPSMWWQRGKWWWWWMWAEARRGKACVQVNILRPYNKRQHTFKHTSLRIHSCMWRRTTFTLTSFSRAVINVNPEHWKLSERSHQEITLALKRSDWPVGILFTKIRSYSLMANFSTKGHTIETGRRGQGISTSPIADSL